VIHLLRSRYRLIGFFYNPNIYPKEEFYRRLETAAVVCRLSGLALWLPENGSGTWTNTVRGSESDPEGGGRCRLCFALRLAGTAAVARQASIPWFATTLTVSPHKDSRVIQRIGKAMAETYQRCFLPEDFKRGGGFHESVRKSKALGLYRQHYCGCRFSQ